MRALYLKSEGVELVDTETIIITGAKAHHFINVLRVQIESEVLVLAGDGHSFTSQVSEIGKRNLVLKILGKKFTERQHEIDIALGLPKKENLDTAVRLMTELGIKTLLPLSLDYSQMSIKRYNLERSKRIIHESMEQSNSFYELRIQQEEIPVFELEKLIELYDLCFCFGLHGSSIDAYKMVFNSHKKTKRVLVIIGPEGGFSNEEMIYLGGLSRILNVSLPLPILRTTTAIPTAIGYILSRL